MCRWFPPPTLSKNFEKNSITNRYFTQYSDFLCCGNTRDHNTANGLGVREFLETKSVIYAQ